MEHSLLDLQVTELLYDLPYFEFAIASGYYTHSLQRFRYILESWAYPYYADIIFPLKSFEEKWEELEGLSQNLWRGFLKRMPEENNLRKKAIMLQKKLNKYTHPDYKTLRHFVTSDPSERREFIAKKAVNLFDETSYKKSTNLFLELFEVLRLFAKAFEEDHPPRCPEYNQVDPLRKM